MERPILNPSIFDDPDRLPDAPKHDVGGAIARFARCLFVTMPRAAFRLTIRVLLMRLHPKWRKPDDANIERPSLVGRYLASVVFRLTFLTLLLLGTIVGNLHLMTHRIGDARSDGPICPGVLAEGIKLQAVDGAVLRAWHVHALDAAQVLKHKDVAARAKWPAVVLAADQRGDGHELDRLIRPLHAAGYVVLVLELRGAAGETAQTFGLLERHDIAAAVANLRGRSYVDRDRISVIATGTAATAALLARRHDTGIDRVFAYAPIASFDDVLAESVNASWLRAGCRWAFEVLQQVDVDDLDTADLARAIGTDAVIANHRPTRSAEVASVVTMLNQPNTVADAR